MSKPLIVALGATLLGIGLAFAGWRGGDFAAFQFPILIGVAMAALGLFMVADVLLRRQAGVEGMVRAATMPVGWMWPAFAVMIGYLLLLERLGFYASAFAAFMAIVTIYARRDPFGPRHMARRVAFGLAFVGVLYVLFAVVLGARLPAGVLI